MHPAQHWQKLEDRRVQCQLCPKHCEIPDGKTGFCSVRRNEAGALYTENYAQVTSLAVDPIEKKPLYHFHPGSSILSVGTFGCNLACEFCQNWQISRRRPSTQTIPVEELSSLAREQGSIGVAFTYNEPTIWFEYVLDGARAVKRNGGKVVLVTNGYINPEPLEELLEFVDALNVDLKSMDRGYYERVCKGTPEPVMETIRRVHRHPRAMVEVTCLLVPEEKDNLEDLRQIREFIASLDTGIPVHLSRYFPRYRMQHPATSEQLMRQGYDLLREKLNFVYVGNVYLPGTGDTYCPACEQKVIERMGYHVSVRGLSGNHCAHCGSILPIVR
mgnify:CR=1 FL=1